jgi:putative inorganic carbon (HCO3(-)) transporter
LLSVLSLLAVMGTFARSMWLSFVVAIPILAFVQSKRFGAIVSSFLLILLVGGMLAVPAFKYRISSIADPGQNETRLNLWKTALKVSGAHLVFGVGEDNWDLMFDRYRVEGYYDTTVHPHNDYLSVLVSSGVPGLVAFLSMWGIILRAGFKTARKMTTKTLRAIARGGMFSLVGLLVGALFQNYYGSFINCLEWWFIAGLMMTAIRLDARGARDVSPA